MIQEPSSPAAGVIATKSQVRMATASPNRPVIQGLSSRAGRGAVYSEPAGLRAIMGALR